MAFDYMTYKEKHWITLKLGYYVSQLVQKNSVSELNQLDRYELATINWFKSLNHWDREKLENCMIGNSWNMFFDEVAIWIDERIPRAYKKWNEEIHDKGPGGVPINCNEHGDVEYGFKYHYDCNYEQVKSGTKVFSPQNLMITVKQKFYLDALAEKNNYKRITEDILMKEASDFISYFKSCMDGEKPYRFDKCFIALG